MMTLLIPFLLLTDKISTTDAEQSGKLKISLYFESLCPDCIDFIMNQLAPTVIQMQGHLDHFILDLIPYGKVQKVVNKLHCQHGPLECAGNKLYACAIDQMITERHQSPLQIELVNFIYCTSTDERDPLQDAEQCSLKTGVNFKLLMQCFHGARGEVLMAGYGNRTRALQPALRWVPTIVINDAYNKTENMMAQDNLLQVVCSHLSNICETN